MQQSLWILCMLTGLQFPTVILLPLLKTPVLPGAACVSGSCWISLCQIWVSKFSKEFRCDFSHLGKGFCGRQVIPVEIRLLFMDWGTVMHTSCDVTLWSLSACQHFYSIFYQWKASSPQYTSAMCKFHVMLQIRGKESDHASKHCHWLVELTHSLN